MTILTYKGQNITQRDIDGYVNITEMGKANDVRFADWLENKQAKEYLKALQEFNYAENGSNSLVVNQGFGANKATWAHPLVAIAFAQWISPQFHVWCNVHIKTLIETGSTSIVEETGKLDWYERLKLYKAKTKIPVGYFSIFEELTTGLVSEFEHAGCKLPHGSVPDISVGKCFCTYLRENNHDISSLTMKYKHYYPDGRVVDANIYHDSLLAEFRKWVQLTYKMNQLPKYLKQNYPTALLTFNKILGLPEGVN